MVGVWMVVVCSVVVVWVGVDGVGVDGGGGLLTDAGAQLVERTSQRGPGPVR